MLPVVESFPYLEKLIRSFNHNKLFHICIYDLSGIHHDNPLLQIPEINRFHMSEFCQFVKTSSLGFRNCIKCKYFSIHRVQSSQHTYTAQCYMGLTEIVKPVYINNRLYSIIYLGNFYLREQENEILNKVKKMGVKLGFQPSVMIEKLESVQVIDKTELEDCYDVVETLYHSIVFAYTGTPTSIKRTSIDSYNYPNKNHWVSQIVSDYIMAHYQSDIRIEQIASLHSMNPNYMRGIFKRCTGISFIDYLHRTRIKNAESLLKNTNLSIIDISTEVGFNNVTYFNKVFKEIVGTNPSIYRYNLLANNHENDNKGAVSNRK